MDDMIIAFEFALVAAGYKKQEPKPIDPFMQELLDYVNSPEYRKLIIDEYNQKNEQRTSE